jgi:hypothetical protein
VTDQRTGILLICGSARSGSTNEAVLIAGAVARLAAHRLQI